MPKFRHVSLENAACIRQEFESGEYTRLDIMFKWKISDTTLKNILRRRGKFGSAA
jgi:hypothetical protein